MTRLMSRVLTAAVLAAASFGINTVAGPSALPLVSAAYAQDAAEIDTSTIVEMVQGAEDAPVTIIEYASYTCPHCARFHEDGYKKLKEEFIDTGKVKFVYREVYFDRYGLWASMMARCAGPEKFFGITDLLFKGQSDWARAGGPNEIVAELRKIGLLAGVEGEALDACLQDGAKAQTLVTWYQENATADKVEATPSFVLNGNLIRNQPYDDMKALIEAELEG
ncbi:thioredoxin domain-containing protein [Epibacterium sp. SM1979]|uniref:Thioredoxin domain-containing protein n=1 Tax=Tritonibacter litoralis TaxID=2662264 RepID=A0A843YFU3_9RHOB|nr:DsbA family protein [Tritonibacter litoralis]MQQ08152.1 thioredoxin domain-containing protein [Tritonibacter litoralis]